MSKLFEPIKLDGDKAYASSSNYSPVAKTLFEKYNQENLQVQQKTEEKTPTIKERIQKTVEETKTKLSEADKRQATGEQRGGSTGLQKTAAVVKGAAEIITSPIAAGVDKLGELIKAGREKQKENDDVKIARGELKPEDALSRKTHIEDQIGEYVAKGMSSEQAQVLRDHYDSLSPAAKANVGSVVDLVSGAFDLATLGVGKKVIEAGGKKVIEKTGEVIAKKEAKVLADKALEAEGKAITDKGTKRALENSTPKPDELTPTEYENLVAQGRIKPKGIKTPASYIPNEDEIKIASKYKDALQSKEPIENAANINKIIKDKDTEVGKFLKDNNGIFNDGELKNFVTDRLKKVTDLTVDEARLDKLKTSTIDNFVNGLQKNDMESLWTARKQFDQEIEKAFSGSPSLQKEVKKEFRNAVQDFIADRTPDTVYKDTMKEMSQLYRLRESVLTKAGKEKDLDGKVAKWIKENPKKAAALGVVGTSVLGTTGYNILTN